MSNYLKKLTLSILASLVLLFSFAPYFRVNAQATAPTTPSATGPWYNQDFFAWYQKVYDQNTSSEIFGERYTAAQVQWVVFGLISYVFNITGSADVFSCVMSNTADLSACASAVAKLFATNKTDPNIAVLKKDEGVLTQIFSTDRPISGIGYISEKVNNFRLIPEAKAQTVGFGFGALSPIQGMWRGTRNVAFGLFVLTSIIFAFMIMFRIKINPQTVITVQSAIPKVITALILVTFSYAIAGFMIDFMYVIIGLLSVIMASFFSSGPGISASGIFNFMIYGQPLGIVNVGMLTPLMFVTFITAPMWIGIIVLTVVMIVGAPLVGGFSLWFLLPLAVVAIVILWIGIKIIWALFKAFANVVLLTIFGPLQIALGVLIPNFGFGQWVKSYFAQLSVFIVTGVLGILSIIFTAQGITIGFQNVSGGSTFTGELLKNILLVVPGVGSAAQLILSSSPWPPLLGGGSGASIGLLFLGVSFVLFTMIPKATELVASFLSGKPFAYGSAIGEAIGPIRWAGSKVYNESGAKDIMEIANLARKSRIMESLIGENKPLRPYVERFVGGGSNQAGAAISNAQKKYREATGRPREV